MRGNKAKIPRSINTGTYLECADNTGARTLFVVSVKKYRGVKNRQPCAGIGDMVVVSVKKGTPEMRKQIFNAVIIRQKKEFRRPDGLRVKFEDNAAVITDDAGVPKGSEIKGPVAREVAERFGKIASSAAIIV
ncbi:MAG: 50S ribosomal protein L14 [Methanothrix sp.]|uniref:Large ribosomal subunit protein uL14 n=1 Tax=Methanothrix thermoacetophila (strain DSM 6194 / JCM 14653 / NBRC 101360 / PT) TaxID=349307 RepID=RL14_METTP|nr:MULTISPECIES: 50S ribosomal protein L14 [Methanothrix]A0B9W0.1 RecName: Full=Large ribosomal subunit protein uL14; AltName: Full=50S ribosomal protein L14 [Methanothrix thermoacetophila PT]ABK15484.1 LSU ribosomal protein L14P [Methanothrix thermoacetophila PT]MBC7080038.1 50S ribosomal protein L14 [Methanothrix sp.]NPU88188.1 50S ribosomal protein L14 [Methanothrix sp.]